MLSRSILACAGLLLACACTSTQPPQSTVLRSPTQAGSALPHLYNDANGQAWLSWVTKTGDSAVLYHSRLQDSTWQPAQSIASGKDWFVNWADYPQVVALPDGGQAACYMRRSAAGKYTYDIYLTHSRGGKWSEPIRLNTDGKLAEHGFVSMLPYNGGLLVAWLDGRNAPDEGHQGHGHAGAMTLRAAHFDAQWQRLQEWELDQRVCDCCQTTLANTSAGPVLIYRDRSEREVRDMSIVRLVNGQWTSPQSLHADGWQINACPVNGPRVDAVGSDVAVAWFTMAGNGPKVRLAFSHDGGAQFGPAITLPRSNPSGRVDVVMADAHSAWVSWLEDDKLLLQRVHDNNRLDSLISIGHANNSRAGGFAQLARVPGGLLMAWTDTDQKTIRTLRIRP